MTNSTIQKHQNKNWEFKANRLNKDGVFYFQNRQDPNLWKVVAFRDGGPLRGTSSVSYADLSARKMKNGKPVIVHKQSDLQFIEDILEGKKVYVGNHLVDTDPTVAAKKL